MCNRLVTVTGVAMVVAAGLSACGQAQTVPRKAARLTIDGVTHTTRPATCSQEHSYRTIDIRNHDSTVQAVVLLSGDRVIPQWVKIRNVDGFNGSFWARRGGQRPRRPRPQHIHSCRQCLRHQQQKTQHGGVNRLQHPRRMLNCGF